MSESIKIRNFGPIKHVNLQVKDLMVLIGPQGTGKSTIAKLIAIFRDNYFLSNLKTNARIFYEYLKRYNIEFEITQKTEIIYQNNQFIFIYKAYEAEFSYISLNFKEISYVPAERLFLSMVMSSFFNLSRVNIPIPKCIIDFGALFEQARMEITSMNMDVLNMSYQYENNEDYITIDKDTKIKLTQSSSGTQAITPMMVVIEHLSKGKNHFIIEEPELNLYPTTQKKLVEFLAEKCVTDQSNLIVTTHSPYILTAFNNLIKAHNIGQEKPDKVKELKKVVKEKYWLDFKKVSAYYIDKGRAKNILDKEYQMINTDFIDKVSEDLGKEFDQLLELKYTE